MNAFSNAIAIMSEQFGKDVTIALATRTETGVNVRTVNGYYKDGCFYVMTYEASHKMREITQDPHVAICKDLMCAQGIGKNLGNPKEEKNKELRNELKEVFSAFYSRHVDEDDPLTCILEIQLTSAAAFTKDTKYLIDYVNGTAQEFPFVNDIIY
jgi:general stress protein 26